MQDQLPAFVGRSGRLTPADADAVARHVAACATCAADVLLLRAVDDEIRLTSPVVDVAPIVAAIPAPGPRSPRAAASGGSSAPSVPSARAPRPRWIAPQSLAAAATLLLVLGVSLMRDGTHDGPPPVAEATPVAELAFEGVDDLSTEALVTLLEEMAGLPASPVAEPHVMVRPIIETPTESP